MSGSLTVIGGHSSTKGLTGLVTVPSGFTGASALVTSLQSLLTADSNSVSAGGANFENLNVATQSGTETATVGGFATGILEITNTSSLGNTTAGAASISLAMPAGYNTLVVQAPGSETVTGNGTAGFLGVFGANSSVNFNAGSGSGSIAASGNDDLTLNGQNWSVFGGSGGHINVVSAAPSLAVTLAGGSGNASSTVPSNAVGSYSPNLSVLSTGTNDFIITGAGNTAGNNHITVKGFANIEDLGGADTIAATGSGSIAATFGFQGGTIDFINQSSVASKIISGFSGSTGLVTSPGSITVSAGAGGGDYIGGASGNNSLVGGTGLVTLYGAGITNYLYADGTGAAGNFLNSASGTNDTLIAGTGSTNNSFAMGQGTDVASSNGAGAQTFFAGTIGSETLTGSTVSGASNTYIFDQAATAGGGNDIITNYKVGTSHAYINFSDGISNVTIAGFSSIAGGTGAQAGSLVFLSDGTIIKLLGVTASTLNASIVGGTQF